ncbi:endonuclease VIII [Lonsdalea populi]|uniref:DNA-(apurinic or apyrimidinic site) lyase n=1 Tax=Lonsdalea populi TaxID=1172565 RepID=A0A3N0UL90_9GAMM|nr:MULTISPECIES: endonuclease VIII [Lonsdalea]RAT17339.1 endonuclease VIII [Lonsdalea quercina]RAT30148.1 endonuclease VIII [Lonsdalea populi]RAT31928.1 endonuclease VIII [Lonsdalea populi]RAT46652.1 endonuclease VIII [Lonsdalea populi]RAT50438.1 endonuclease VIII [Lonsdalea populi]
MPEGPEIRRAADMLSAAIAGKTLTAAWFAFPALKIYEHRLAGAHVTQIVTRGKALLTCFSNDCVLYSHNQLYGVWRVGLPETLPETKRDLRVRLTTADSAVSLYSASDIDILTTDQLATHPFLQRIGPDVLDMTVTAEQVQERLLSPRFRRRQFSGLLLDQTFLAGLGNYLRAEILWQAELAPQHRAADLSPQQLAVLSQALLEIPRLSYRTRGEGDERRHHGAVFRFRVFHRAGKPCERCGHLIERSVLSSRPFYCCSHCQR